VPRRLLVHDDVLTGYGEFDANMDRSSPWSMWMRKLNQHSASRIAS